MEVMYDYVEGDGGDVWWCWGWWRWCTIMLKSMEVLYDDVEGDGGDVRLCWRRGGDYGYVEGVEIVMMMTKVMRCLWWRRRWRIGDYEVKGDEEMTDNCRWWEDDYGNVEGDEEVIMLVLKVVEVIMIFKVRISWSCWRGSGCDVVESLDDLIMKWWRQWRCCSWCSGRRSTWQRKKGKTLNSGHWFVVAPHRQKRSTGFGHPQVSRMTWILWS